MDRARTDEGGKGGRGRRRLLFALASTVASLIVAEVGLRVAAKLAGRVRGLDYHAEYGWKMIPNVEKRGFLWGGEALSRVNSAGWRDDEFSLDPDPARPRVAVVGDSFTFGVGIDHGERFTERMEARGLDVLNFGVNSSGTDQQLRYLEEEVLAYRPSVVVMVTFLGNDLEDIRFERKRSWPKPYYDLVDGELRLVKPRADALLALRTRSYLAELGFRVLEKAFDRDRVAPPWESRDTVPLYVALVARARDVARGKGARFLVALVHPTPLDGREAAVRAGLRAARVETFDTRELFEGRQDGGLYLHDGHWSARGHAVFATALCDRLRTLGWIGDER